MALKEIKTKAGKFEISYEIINPKNKKDFILLHGWGSDKEIMKKAFSSSFSDFRHIYIDMPGFGKSKNSAILNSKDYKDIIESFLNAINSDKRIIAGHSFGGKIATLLQPSFLILLSSAGIVLKKPIKVKTKILIFKLLKHSGLKKIGTFFASKDVKNMDQNMYETFKNVVDEDFEEIFREYQKPALLFWGDEDSATPLECAKKIDSLMNDSKLYVLKGDHYFFLNHAKTVEKTVKEEFYGQI